MVVTVKVLGFSKVAVALYETQDIRTLWLSCGEIIFFSSSARERLYLVVAQHSDSIFSL